MMLRVVQRDAALEMITGGPKVPEMEPRRRHDPMAFDQPEEKSLEWARNPEMMRQMKETREKQIEELKQKTRASDR
jgi:hypothetical protein